MARLKNEQIDLMSGPEVLDAMERLFAHLSADQQREFVAHWYDAEGRDELIARLEDDAEEDEEG